MEETEAMSCMAWISLVKDLVVAAAAATGAIVAVMGLTTWKRQLHGQNEYELARRLLVTTFKYRDEIDKVRNPVMFNEEQPVPPDDEAGNMNDNQVRHYGVSHAYQARWDAVRAVRVNLDADLLEAEAMWGSELTNLYQTIFNLQHELFNDIRQYLELINPRTQPAMREALVDIRRTQRDVMYDLSGAEPDDYKRELLASIDVIKGHLMPYLMHDQRE